MGELKRIVVSLILLFGFTEFSNARKWHQEKYYHQPAELDATTYQKLALEGSRINFEALLDPILIPRVPGTENHAAVRKFIVDHMKNLNWDVEEDAFVDETPFGPKPFTNIIATLNPNVHRRLVMACHYDSKYYENMDFVAAVDSAVPCAQLMHLASTMQPLLDDHKNSPQNVTLQFIFFDGEEAFVRWTATDSIYGARHLASKWQSEFYPANQRDTTMLHRMDFLMLLDLLGNKDSRLPAYFEETSHWHNTLVQSEQQLKKSRFWSGTNSKAIFLARRSYGGIEDDHIPFLQRGVDVLHLIPTPFPSVWHSERDNKANLDFPTIDNLNKVFRLFVARYLHLPVASSSS